MLHKSYFFHIINVMIENDEIAEIKTYARREAVPIMQDETQEFICNYIKELSQKLEQVRVLEIGTAIGYSAIQFARVAENVTVSTIEIDIDRYLKAIQNIKNCGLETRIIAYHADALTFEFPTVTPAPQFDLIFIDAAKGQYINFFEKYKANLAPNGVIISDNLSFHGMVEDLSLTHNYSTKKLVKKIRKYVLFLRENQEFQTEFFECGDGISVSKKSKK